MTTTLQQPAAAGPAREIKPLWPDGVAIDVLGVTGNFASGKSLFVSTIDPRNTLAIDFEKSLGTYAGSLGLTRIDFPQYMRDADYAAHVARMLGFGLLNEHRFPNGYKPLDVFREFLFILRNLPSDRFSVIAVDPISDIEIGLDEHVSAQYRDFGFSSAQAFEKTGGIFWNEVRNFWKAVLADASTRCQTFAFTTHLKTVWKNGAPTREQTWKGKSTLAELCSLFLWLEREPDKTGAVPQKPAAKVIKSRLAKIIFDEATGDVQTIPCLPPRIPVCTPAEIRKYILNPPNYDKLAKGEKIVERQASEEDLKLLELETQKARAEAATAELERVTREQEREERRAAAEARRAPAPDQAAAVNAAATERRESAARAAEATAAIEPAAPATNGQRQPAPQQAPASGSRIPPETFSQDDLPPPTPGPQAPPNSMPANGHVGGATVDQCARLLQLRETLQIPWEGFRASIIKRTGNPDKCEPSHLTEEQAAEAIAKLEGFLAGNR